MKKEKRKDLLAKIVLSAYSIPIILGINLVKNELLGKPNDNNLILYQNENMLIKKTYSKNLKMYYNPFFNSEDLTSNIEIIGKNKITAGKNYKGIFVDSNSNILKYKFENMKNLSEVKKYLETQLTYLPENYKQLSINIEKNYLDSLNNNFINQIKNNLN